MGRVNIEYNGKWACFTTISDGFITPFMSKTDYDEWRKEEYGNHCPPITPYNTMEMIEAVNQIYYYSRREQTLTELTDCGISLEDATKLINEVEDKYYRPKLADNDLYVCPNCKNASIEKGQKRCKNELCEIQFVW